MRALIEKLFVKPAGWLGLSYLGYWVALALQSVVVPAAVIPLFGGSVSGWAVTPWQARFTTAAVEGPNWVTSGINLLPLLLQIVFLAAVALAGQRLRPAALRIGSFFDLLPGAEHLAAKLKAISRKWRKPILFTEIGYPSVEGGSSEPWVEDARRNVNLAEQAAAYEAIFRVLTGRPWFRGMFWWKWPSSGRGGGAQDPSYTPMGKPAAEVIRAWYTRLAANSSSAVEQAP